MIAIIKDRGETYVSPVFVEKVAVVPGDAFGCAVDFETLPNDPYIVCKGMEWKIEIL